MLELLKIQTELKAPKTQFNKFGGISIQKLRGYSRSLKATSRKV
ncbi:hypothetical protein [Campylobacter hyointestinalis]|nr:hypothetical protein [Campylobacter hyointestinalis]